MYHQKSLVVYRLECGSDKPEKEVRIFPGEFFAFF